MSRVVECVQIDNMKKKTSNLMKIKKLFVIIDYLTKYIKLKNKFTSL